MRYKPDKYEKVTKVWTPLISFLLLTIVLLLTNFNKLGYVMNGDYYRKQTGVIMEHNTDNLFFIIPMVKVRWEYKGKTYDIERLDFTNVSEGSPVSIAVNTKAPNHCLLLDNSRLLWFNIIVGLLWATTLGFLIRHIYLRRSQKVWIKYYPEFMKALSEVDILKGDMK